MHGVDRLACSGVSNASLFTIHFPISVSSLCIDSTLGYVRSVRCAGRGGRNHDEKAMDLDDPSHVLLRVISTALVACRSRSGLHRVDGCHVNQHYHYHDRDFWIIDYHNFWPHHHDKFDDISSGFHDLHGFVDDYDERGSVERSLRCSCQSVQLHVLREGKPDHQPALRHLHLLQMHCQLLEWKRIHDRVQRRHGQYVRRTLRCMLRYS